MTNDFPDPRLLTTDYLVQLRECYEDCDTPERRCFINVYRNYHALLSCLSNIHDYDPQHFKSYAKRLREQQRDFKSCESIFSEIIVYRHYLRLVSEGIVASIEGNDGRRLSPSNEKPKPAPAEKPSDKK